MRLLRSWPATVPAGRSYVVDGVERLVMDRFDYRVLTDVDDDVLLLEWDIAVSREDLLRFRQLAREDPARVVVAPYRLYVTSRERERLAENPFWAHRRFDSPHSTRFVTPADATCHLFGLGMTYLPRALVLRFLDFLATMSPERVFDDSTFSQWHYVHGGQPEVPVAWDVRPVHLHYQLPDGLGNDHG